MTPAPSDGAVLLRSARMDERVGGSWSPNLRSPIDWIHVTFLFPEHLGMTKDPAFSDNVLYLLGSLGLIPSARQLSGRYERLLL